MKIEQINNKEIWENFFLENNEEKTFLQSWNWGEFQKKMGNKIWRLGLFDNKGDPISFILVVRVAAKRGTFFMIQHGPIINEQKTASASTCPTQVGRGGNKKQVLETLLNELKKIAKKENCRFLRIIPLWERNKENQKLLQDFGFKNAPLFIAAYEATLKLDIRPSEEELLKKMRKTTRYLIKQAERNKDITIFQSQKKEDVEIFEKIQQKMVKKKKFVPFSFKYLKNQFDVFIKDNEVTFFFGKYQGKIIAGAMVIFRSKIGFYHYAALLPEYRNVPINYLLQWEAIKEARKRGCELYDFWGYVNPEKEPRHPWVGPSLFKMGFGGQPFEYIKTQDLPLSWKYWLTSSFEKLRKIKRRL